MKKPKQIALVTENVTLISKLENLSANAFSLLEEIPVLKIKVINVMYLKNLVMNKDFVLPKNVGVTQDSQEKIVKQNNYFVQVRKFPVVEMTEGHVIKKEKMTKLTKKLAVYVNQDLQDLIVKLNLHSVSKRIRMKKIAVVKGNVTCIWVVCVKIHTMENSVKKRCNIFVYLLDVVDLIKEHVMM